MAGHVLPALQGLDVTAYRIATREAQRAVQPARLRDVLLSLRRNGIILRFRIQERETVVEGALGLEVLMGAIDDESAA